MAPASSPPHHEAIRAWRRSPYAGAFLAGRSPLAEAWLHDLRLHALLALLMARATPGAPVPRQAWTQRGLGALCGLSATVVQGVLARACDRGDFQRQAVHGDRRRAGLVPTARTALAFGALLRDAVVAALAGGAPGAGPPIDPAEAAVMAGNPDLVASYARFACALVVPRRPGGRLWVRPEALALLADLLLAPPEGADPALLRRLARRRRGGAEGLHADLATAAMAGLVQTEPGGGAARLTEEGRTHLLAQIETWRDWTEAARLLLTQEGGPGAPAPRG
jgi:hypothetical protein